MSKKVAVFLADGFEEVEAIAPIDLLRRAEIEVDTVSLTDESLVTSARKVKVVADKVINEINFDKYDMSKLGILENKKAICFPACENGLLEGKPILTHERVVVDGNIVTSRSAGTAIDFALEIISQLLGSKKSKEIKDEIVYSKK